MSQQSEQSDVVAEPDESKSPEPSRFVGTKKFYGVVALGVLLLGGSGVGLANTLTGSKPKSNVKKSTVKNHEKEHVIQSSKSKASQQKDERTSSSSGDASASSSNSSSSNASRSSSSSNDGKQAELVAENNVLPKASDYYIGQHVQVKIFGQQVLAVIQSINNDSLIVSYENNNYTVNFERNIK